MFIRPFQYSVDANADTNADPNPNTNANTSTDTDTDTESKSTTDIYQCAGEFNNINERDDLVDDQRGV